MIPNAELNELLQEPLSRKYTASIDVTVIRRQLRLNAAQPSRLRPQETPRMKLEALVETQDPGGAEYPGDVERESVNEGWVMFSDEVRVMFEQECTRDVERKRSGNIERGVAEREPVGSVIVVVTVVVAVVAVVVAVVVVVVVVVVVIAVVVREEVTESFLRGKNATE
jgi:hypothetical protein